MGLADEIIKNNSDQNRECNDVGIDDLGFPAPQTPNTDYVVARILARDKTLFKLNGSVYSNRKQIIRENNIPAPKQILFMCGEPKIICPRASATPAELAKWSAKVIHVINTYAPIIYERLYEMIPQYNKRYIQITDNLIWDKEKGDFVDEKPLTMN